MKGIGEGDRSKAVGTQALLFHRAQIGFENQSVKAIRSALNI
jgi:hypothetical protein